MHFPVGLLAFVRTVCLCLTFGAAFGGDGRSASDFLQVVHIFAAWPEDAEAGLAVEDILEFWIGLFGEVVMEGVVEDAIIKHPENNQGEMNARARDSLAELSRYCSVQ